MSSDRDSLVFTSTGYDVLFHLGSFLSSAPMSTWWDVEEPYKGKSGSITRLSRLVVRY